MRLCLLALHLNFLFCTILANRSLGKDLAAPRQGDGRERKKKREREERREREQLHQHSYGLGARSCFIDWFPMDDRIGDFSILVHQRIFRQQRDMFITTARGGSSPGQEHKSRVFFREDQAQDIYWFAIFWRFLFSRSESRKGLFVGLFVFLTYFYFLPTTFFRGFFFFWRHFLLIVGFFRHDYRTDREKSKFLASWDKIRRTHGPIGFLSNTCTLPRLRTWDFGILLGLWSGYRN